MNIDKEKLKAKIDQLESKLHLMSSELNYHPCNFCECKTKDTTSLREHIKTYHCHDKESQHQERPSMFEEYPCFYCTVKIKSLVDLETHIKACCKQLVTPTSGFPCEECRSNFDNDWALSWHKIMTHGPFALKPA